MLKHWKWKKLSDIVKKESVDIAILTVPSEFAQNVTDVMVKSGITSIWNFTNTKLKVPDDVLVLREDLSSSYAVLSVCS